MNISSSRTASAAVGITRFAQGQLGDVVFVELPDIGAQRKRGEEAGVVESVKAASEVFSPVSGEVVEVNSRPLRQSGPGQ